MEPVKTEWYVVFTDYDVVPHWVHRFLKKKFLHCYCFRQIGDFIYYANPTISNIDSKIYQDISPNQLAHRITFKENAKILKIKYPFDFNNRVFNIWNLAPTCVSAVKMFLGLTCKVQTPYQLYKHLLKLGAKPINHYKS